VSAGATLAGLALCVLFVFSSNPRRKTGADEPSETPSSGD